MVPLPLALSQGRHVEWLVLECRLPASAAACPARGLSRRLEDALVLPSLWLLLLTSRCLRCWEVQQQAGGWQG